MAKHCEPKVQDGLELIRSQVGLRVMEVLLPRVTECWHHRDGPLCPPWASLLEQGDLGLSSYTLELGKGRSCCFLRCPQGIFSIVLMGNT